MKLKGLLNHLSLDIDLDIYPQCEGEYNPVIMEQFTFKGKMLDMTHAQYETLAMNRVGDIITLEDGVLHIPVDCSHLDKNF